MLDKKLVYLERSTRGAGGGEGWWWGKGVEKEKETRLVCLPS